MAVELEDTAQEDPQRIRSLVHKEVSEHLQRSDVKTVSSRTIGKEEHKIQALRNDRWAAVNKLSDNEAY